MIRVESYAAEEKRRLRIKWLLARITKETGQVIGHTKFVEARIFRCTTISCGAFVNVDVRWKACWGEGSTSGVPYEEVAIAL